MTRKSKVFAAVMAAFMAQGAFAETTFNGYLRSGSGANSEGGKEACFRINAPAMGGVVGGAGRLGNECDTYGELALGADMGESAGTKFKLHTLIAFGTQQLGDWEQSTPSWREAYASAEGVGTGALASANIWVGKRYYKRSDIHIVDFFTLANTGPGAGIENIDLGVGKLSYALMRSGEQDWSNEAQGGFNPDVANGGKKAISVHDVRLEGINLGAAGSLSVGTSILQKNVADDVSGGKGFSTFVTHSINNIFGQGTQNSLMFQTAKDGVNLDGSGRWWADANTKYKAWRLLDTVNFDFGDVNGSAFLGYGSEEWGDGGASKTLSVVVRPVYHFSENYSLAVEAGTTRVNPNGNGANYHLNKLTIAPQLSMGKSFWARPALRAYYTYASWNDAAGNPACTGRDCGRAMTAFAGKTSGSSYGVQMEAWW
jgi:maltoporin